MWDTLRYLLSFFCPYVMWLRLTGQPYPPRSADRAVEEEEEEASTSEEGSETEEQGEEKEKGKEEGDEEMEEEDDGEAEEEGEEEDSATITVFDRYDSLLQRPLFAS